MKSPNAAVDALVHASARATSTLEWTLFQLGCDGALTNHETEQDCLDLAHDDLVTNIAMFDRYSDGRPVHATVDIEAGRVFDYIFPALSPVDAGERLVVDSPLPHDPGTPPRGTYRVLVDDHAGTIRVEVLEDPVLRIVTPVLRIVTP
ncbi:hypothetical protein [Gordonia sp. NPDC003585]|uniref:hypothetical protein n=1 Tax=Gordonia sp. NPDC003585 TaxID=3154275 RepID=UPI0033A1B164